MLALVYVFVGFLAALTSAGVFIASLDAPTRVILATLAMMLWGYWALSSFRVTTVTDGGQVVAESYQGLAAIGIAIAAVLLLTLVRLVFTGLWADRTQADREMIP